MDAADFGPIYRRHAADVFRFALYLCGNRPDDSARDRLAGSGSRPRDDRHPSRRSAGARGGIPRRESRRFREAARTVRGALRDIPIPPDAEARTLRQTKDLIGGGAWLRGTRLVAVVLTILAIARLGSDDGETIWGRVFVAGAAWLIHLVSLHRALRNALRAATPRSE
jgi:hypothetical protein